MGRLEKQVAIVTGAGRGIGKSIALLLGREGAKIVLASRTGAELETVSNELAVVGARSLICPTDITQIPDVERLVESAVTEFGRIDILVNNAGIGIFKRCVDLGVEDFDSMWNVNMRGVFVVTQTVLPHMMARKSGAIVNVSSLAGKNSFVNGTGYAATKWALRGFASSLMLEVREFNIRVLTVFPGSVDTSFSSKGKRGDKITQPEDVAEAVLFGICAPPRTMISEIDIRPTNPA